MHPLCGHVVVSGPDQCCADQAWESFWSTMESILTPALLHAINKPETMKGMYAAPVRSGSKGHVLGKSNDTRKKSTTQGAEIVLETWGIIEKDCDHYGVSIQLCLQTLCFALQTVQDVFFRNFLNPLTLTVQDFFIRNFLNPLTLVTHRGLSHYHFQQNVQSLSTF